MTPHSLRACALTALVLLGACGGDVGVGDQARRGAAQAIALPGAGASWTAGPGPKHADGRLVVGLLVHQGIPQRLATLVAPDKLAAYLEHEPEERFEAAEQIIDPSGVYRIWGREATRLVPVAKAVATEHGVDVEFREVLAEECGELPLVFVGRRPLSRPERVALKSYRDRGGRVVRLRARRQAGRAVSLADVSISDMAGTAMREALRGSPLLVRLPRSPFALEAERVGDDVVLRCPLGAQRVALVDPAGKVLLEVAAAAAEPVRLRAPDPALDPFAHRIVVAWRGEGVVLRRAWRVVDLVGTVEREVFASEQVDAGAVMALRIHTYASKAGRALGGQKGRVALLRKGAVLVETNYETDAHGYAHPRLLLGPEIGPGAATLHIDGIERSVRVTSGVRLSVVTDRPLYKQTDVVHVRAMVQRSGDGRPVAGAKIQLTLGDAKRYVTTSKSGIASHAFTLQDARVGKVLVKGVVQDAKARCAIRVKAFERPTFTLESERDELVLRAGEAAPVTLRARYVNGTPVVGAKVTLKPSAGLLTPDAPTHTSADGGVALSIATTPAFRGGSLIVRVQDVDGRLSERAIVVRIERQDVQLEIAALSDVVLGVPARFALTASEPGRYLLDGAFEGARAVQIGRGGQAVTTLTPTTMTLELRLRSADGESSISRTFPAGLPEPDRLFGALDRRTVRVGEELTLTLLGASGWVRVDVWKGPTAVWTQAVRLEKHRATLAIPVDARMAGVLHIRATPVDDALNFWRATVLATRGRALQVSARPGAAAYAPGATARVDVQVRDARGEPTSAVLGYWGVDEALLALAPMTTGHEQVFDVLGAVAAPKAYALAEQVDRGRAVALGDAKGVLDASKGGWQTGGGFPIHVLRTAEWEDAASKAAAEANRKRLGEFRTAYLAAWKGIPLTELVASDSLRESVRWLVAREVLDASHLSDVWGTPYALWADVNTMEIMWRSAGPDCRFGTGDDLGEHWCGAWLYWELPERIQAFHAFVRAHYEPGRDLQIAEEVLEQELATEEPIIKDEEIFDQPATVNDLPFEESFAESEGLSRRLGAAFEGPSTNTTIGLGGGASRGFLSRCGSRDLGTGGGGRRRFTARPQYVRKDFDPTLCFVPQALVGPDGRASLSIALKDSITTWRLRLVASNTDGAVGVGYGSLRVRQPIHASPWLAPHLTVGDLIEVPVAVRNEEAHAVTARVVASVSAHLEQRAASETVLELGPGATGRATFRFRARDPGQARVRIEVDTGAARDLQERIVQIHPYARTVVDVLSGSVRDAADFPTVMAAAGPGEVRMDLYPSPLAEVVSGFEGLIRAPHG